MFQNTTPPPVGPRAARLGPLRGAIQKRSRDSSRADRNSEMEIDTAGDMIGKGRRDTRRERNPLWTRGGAASGPHVKTLGSARNSLNAAAVQKAIFRSLGSDEAMTRVVRQGPRAARLLGKHTGNARDPGATGLTQLVVRGLKDSKAASNPDGGIKDLLAFLERKASADLPARETVKIKKVCLTPCSLVHGDTTTLRLSGPLSFQAKFSERRPLRNSSPTASAHG